MSIGEDVLRLRIGVPHQSHHGWPYPKLNRSHSAAMTYDTFLRLFGGQDPGCLREPRPAKGVLP